MGFLFLVYFAHACMTAVRRYKPLFPPVAENFLTMASKPSIFAILLRSLAVILGPRSTGAGLWNTLLPRRNRSRTASLSPDAQSVVAWFACPAYCALLHYAVNGPAGAGIPSAFEDVAPQSSRSLKYDLSGQACAARTKVILRPSCPRVSPVSFFFFLLSMNKPLPVVFLSLKTMSWVDI